jgi:hypothetical protein
MAKTAKRKRKPAAATGKRRRTADLLDIAPSAAARAPRETSPEELLEGEKAWERIRRALEQRVGHDDQPEELLEWEKAWVQIGRALETWSQNLCEALEIQPALKLPDDWASPSPPVDKLSGKKWVPIAYARRPNELLGMTITEASHALFEESKTASDCAKPLKPRYIEKRLRELGSFPRARRNPPKRRPK